MIFLFCFTLLENKSKEPKEKALVIRSYKFFKMAAVVDEVGKSADKKQIDENVSDEIDDIEVENGASAASKKKKRKKKKKKAGKLFRELYNTQYTFCVHIGLCFIAILQLISVDLCVRCG